VKIEKVQLSKLKSDPNNARKHSEQNIKAIADSLCVFGQQKPVVALKDGTIIAGNGTLEAAKLLKWKELAVKRFEDPKLARAFAIADNRTAELAEWDDKQLARELQKVEASGLALEVVGFSEQELEGLVASLKVEGQKGLTLAERFGVPPFSVLDSRQGYWRQRKAAWLSLGIQSEVGRKGNLLGMSNTMLEPDPKQRAKMKVGGYEGGNAFSGKGTSVFDPVLCELVYKWFLPKKGSVLDPFAGGSVRGIVAGRLGHPYLGVDLRAEQVKANEEQAKAIKCPAPPAWQVGDAAKLDKLLEPKLRFDLLFSCPPYFDLEQYSDEPGDLSTMGWEAFKKAYKGIVAACADHLRPNSFAAFVVGDIRDEKGYYRSFPALTVEAFEAVGLRLYNEAVLVTSAGTLPLRAGRTFAASRKLGKTHQNLLVFFKGDPATIRSRYGEPEFGELNAEEE